jgi:transcriptional regulator with XRE-family HTH domain
MSDTSPWPLGPALEQARTSRGLATREAARIAGISDTQWRNMERGYELRKGNKIAVSPRADTVERAARVVGLNVEQALRLAGLEVSLPDLAEHDTGPDLSAVDLDDLLGELRRRAVGAVRAATEEDISTNPRLITGPPRRRVHVRSGDADWSGRGGPA